MSYFNQNVYKNTYLLEFRVNNMPESSIAFSVPQQSEDIDMPQRIAETKTFGGSIIEDYGNDTVKITITGSTVNNKTRIVYKGKNGGLAYMKGDEEIFYIKNLIKTYGSTSKLQQNKSVYLYALSNGKTNLNKWWKVAIEDFDIKRNKDKPIAYDYTLTCIGLPEESTGTSTTSWINKIMEILNKAISFIRGVTEKCNEWLSAYRSVLDLIEQLDNFLDDFESTLNNFVDTINGFVATTSDYIDETNELFNDIIDTSIRIVLGTPAKLYDSALSVLKAANSLMNYFRTAFDDNSSTNIITMDLLESFGMTTQEFKDTWLELIGASQDSACEIVATTKKMTGIVNYSIIPGAIGEDDEVVYTGGYVTTTVKDGDSWDSLALKYYNDANYSTTLALYNGNDGAVELAAGTKIKIPCLGYNAEMDNNQVYNTPDSNDNYGADVNTSGNSGGDVEVEQNDFATTSGTDNMDQAIMNRLQTNVENRIRLELYGIRSEIGSNQTSLQYLFASITETMVNDPRVKTVDSIKLTGEGDNITILIDYTDINDTKQSFGGTY